MTKTFMERSSYGAKNEFFTFIQIFKKLMLKVPDPGKDHGYLEFITGFNGNPVVLGAPGLDDGPDTCGRGGLHHIGEGKKGVRGQDPGGAPGSGLSGDEPLAPVQGQLRGPDPVGFAPPPDSGSPSASPPP
jgi:hypothetical protein